ncbi:50S ribosomal protein L20 [Candidatus Shapirobacteria bacterium CG09_land_8_20_14_0_10_38_17]|uniref:Large ribosomal subunit protein bL20 n=1 Tax=Candidatus Shapirobacteria bacterium CG09_land_8_20_14_0_10_38_17 TaxID=1974884 RepID=A0A2H0WRZ4_9BACT|nr:MAG: 50S ribosomal protein L20 [Candidatus Shapirobacteria bacterium CG09_land_8_20_14_0_10_38_17]
MRVKTGTIRHAKHKKTLKATKGYRMTRNRLYKVAHEAELHAGQYAYAGRKNKKRDLRQLWIQRINAALSSQNLKYNQFIHLLEQKNITLNRKILAELAVNDPATFKFIVSKAKEVVKDEKTN